MSFDDPPGDGDGQLTHIVHVDRAPSRVHLDHAGFRVCIPGRTSIRKADTNQFSPERNVDFDRRSAIWPGVPAPN